MLGQKIGTSTAATEIIHNCYIELSAAIGELLVKVGTSSPGDLDLDRF